MSEATSARGILQAQAWSARLTIINYGVINFCTLSKSWKLFIFVVQVVIDDRLPISHSGELLCSYSNNADEFWVSLIEKAYMKVYIVKLCLVMTIFKPPLLLILLNGIIHAQFSLSQTFV